MGKIYRFQEATPKVSSSAFLHPDAVIIGDVIIGNNVYIGAGAVLRGDIGRIIVFDGSNIQDNCVVHTFPGEKTIFKKNSHIGHSAVVHGAIIGENSLVGMNAVLMDGVILGNECIVGALSFLPQGMSVPDRSLVAGNPAKIIKAVTEDMINWKSKGTEIYQELAKNSIKYLKEASPSLLEGDDLEFYCQDKTNRSYNYQPLYREKTKKK